MVCSRCGRLWKNKTCKCKCNTPAPDVRTIRRRCLKIQRRWSDGIRAARQNLPPLPWEVPHVERVHDHMLRREAS